MDSKAIQEITDRIRIRELIEWYARCADRRDAEGQMALFTEDMHFVVYMDAKSAEPTWELNGREALAPVFADLNQYHATTHFLGQNTLFEIDAQHAKGETYCLAHHVTVKGNSRQIMIASLRYTDTFVKQDGKWLFAERQLFVDWTDTRELQ